MGLEMLALTKLVVETVPEPRTLALEARTPLFPEVMMMIWLQLDFCYGHVLRHRIPEVPYRAVRVLCWVIF